MPQFHEVATCVMKICTVKWCSFTRTPYSVTIGKQIIRTYVGTKYVDAVGTKKALGSSLHAGPLSFVESSQRYPMLCSEVYDRGSRFYTHPYVIT